MGIQTCRSGLVGLGSARLLPSLFISFGILQLAHVPKRAPGWQQQDSLAVTSAHHLRRLVFAALCGNTVLFRVPNAARREGRGRVFRCPNETGASSHDVA
jgi:hypothetical protein